MNMEWVNELLWKYEKIFSKLDFFRRISSIYVFCIIIIIILWNRLVELDEENFEDDYKQSSSSEQEYEPNKRIKTECSGAGYGIYNWDFTKL